MKKTKIFIYEPNELFRIGLQQALGAVPDFVVDGTFDEHGEKIVVNYPDVIVARLSADALSIEILRELKIALPAVRVVVLSASREADQIIEAMYAGAVAYCASDSPVSSIVLAVKSTCCGAGVWIDSALTRPVLDRWREPHQHPNATLQGIKKFDAAKSDRFDLLSPRELEVLRLISEGLSNREIADKLIISSETVKSHVHNLMEKLHVNDRTRASIMAIKAGLFD
jgi:two-component system, NarL family, response regulator LiaR